MGQSLAPVAAASTLERYDKAAHDPFEAEGFRYQAEQRPNGVFHVESAMDPQGRIIAQVEAEVQFAVGSGQRGRSYVINRDGFLFNSSLTWYPEKRIWDLSPGYTARNHPHFGRPVAAACLYCHCNQVEPHPETANRFRAPLFRGYAIGCERCHGPGELHVERRKLREEVAGVDDTIVNPRNLPHSLREAVCQQCHLQGEQRIVRHGRKLFDYRPGLPLQLFLRDFVKRSGQSADTKFVGTVEQMYASACFKAGKDNDKMGCISCHNPHEAPAAEQKVAYYRDRCLACHARKGCNLPIEARRTQQKDDSCIACHMPRGRSNINHAAITNHRIPRQRPDQAQRAEERPQPGLIPLEPFHRDISNTDEPEFYRDLGLALVEETEKHPTHVAKQLSEAALPLLQKAIDSDPDDVLAWHARATALWYQERWQEALAACHAVLQKQPERELTLYLAAGLARRLKRVDDAAGYCRRAIVVNPWRWQYHQTLGAIFAEKEEWQPAAEACRRALTLNPFSLSTRRQLIVCYVRQGQGEDARREFGTLLGMHPSEQQASFARWFETQMPRK
jgi:tetratricopeptide (TPR) repeat protein